MVRKYSQWQRKLNFNETRIHLMTMPYSLRPRSYISSTQGLKFLHDSSIGFHGCLSASKCLIDSRWLLKITDFGLIKMYQLAGSSLPERSYDELLSTAPEMLRTFSTGSNSIEFISYSSIDQSHHHSKRHFTPYENQRMLQGSQEADIYSLGIIMAQVISSEPLLDLFSSNSLTVEGKRSNRSNAVTSKNSPCHPASNICSLQQSPRVSSRSPSLNVNSRVTISENIEYYPMSSFLKPEAIAESKKYSEKNKGIIREILSKIIEHDPKKWTDPIRPGSFEKPPDVPTDAMIMMARCWSESSEKRPTAKMISENLKRFLSNG